MVQITLNITNPVSARIIRALAKTMDGVTIEKKRSSAKKNSLDMAIEDVEKDRVTTWSSVDDLIKHIESL